MAFSYVFHILDFMCMRNRCNYQIFHRPTKDRDVKMSDKLTSLYCIREVSALNLKVLVFFQVFETHSIATRPHLHQHNHCPELSNHPLISHLTIDDI